MTANLKPYSEYQESEIPWLGKVPKHWEIVRLKSVVSNISQQTAERRDSEAYIALEHVESWTGRIRKAGSEVSFNGQVKRFQAGDILFGRLRPYLAKVARPTVDGVCVGEFFVLRPSSFNTLAPYVEKMLGSKPIIDAINGTTFGARMPRADWQSVGNMGVALPPVHEQAAIVRYLDYVDRRISRYIRAKRRLIELLNEQKQAIIHQASTGRIDVRTGEPYQTYQPSGIEWLGDVPAHWTPSRLRFVAKIQTGLTLGKNYGMRELEERPYLRVANVQDGRLDLNDVAAVQLPRSEIVGRELQVGDVLMTEGGDIDKLGRGHIWHGEIEGCLHQNHIFAVRTDHNILLPKFLTLLMASGHGRSYFQLTAKQTTNLASTNSTTLGSFPLFLPSIGEQREILAYASKVISAANEAIVSAKAQIDHIQEYRTRLIADVVTGKFDVGEAAACLPGEAEEPEPLDIDNEGLEAIEGVEEVEDTSLEVLLEG